MTCLWKQHRWCCLVGAIVRNGTMCLAQDPLQLYFPWPMSKTHNAYCCSNTRTMTLDLPMRWLVVVQSNVFDKPCSIQQVQRSYWIEKHVGFLVNVIFSNPQRQNLHCNLPHGDLSNHHGVVFAKNDRKYKVEFYSYLLISKNYIRQMIYQQAIGFVLSSLHRICQNKKTNSRPLTKEGHVMCSGHANLLNNMSWQPHFGLSIKNYPYSSSSGEYTLFIYLCLFFIYWCVMFVLFLLLPVPHTMCPHGWVLMVRVKAGACARCSIWVPVFFPCKFPHKMSSCDMSMCFWLCGLAQNGCLGPGARHFPSRFSHKKRFFREFSR